MLVVAPNRAAAERIAKAITAAAGLPHCSHYKWWLDPAGVARWDRLTGPRGSRGWVPPCTCTSATDVDVDCPHVTWQAAAVIRLEDGTVCVEASAAALAAVPEARGLPARVLSDAEREASEEPWRLRDERRAARVP